MIQINNLQKRFGEKTAVNIDNYLISQGDMLGLVGNNGAGKTTLFRLILDLLQADRGNVTINEMYPKVKTGRDLPALSLTTVFL
jgi:ABC-2 type transport system ATP-binding protein